PHRGRPRLHPSPAARRLAEARGFDFPTSVRPCSLARTAPRASCLTLGVLSLVLRVPQLIFKCRRFQGFLYACRGQTRVERALRITSYFNQALPVLTRSRHQTMFAPHAAFADCIMTQRGKPDRIPAEFRIGGQAMESVIAKLLQDFEQGKMNRRQLI